MEQEFLRSSCFRLAPKAKGKALRGQLVEGKPILSGQVNSKKRKREAAPPKDSPGSGEYTITRRKLTQRNLELWNEEKRQKNILIKFNPKPEGLYFYAKLSNRFILTILYSVWSIIRSNQSPVRKNIEGRGSQVFKA